MSKNRSPKEWRSWKDQRNKIHSERSFDANGFRKEQDLLNSFDTNSASTEIVENSQELPEVDKTGAEKVLMGETPVEDRSSEPKTLMEKHIESHDATDIIDKSEKISAEDGFSKDKMTMEKPIETPLETLPQLSTSTKLWGNT